MRRVVDGSGTFLRRAGIVLACLVPIILLVGILISDELYTRLRATPNQTAEQPRAWADAPVEPAASGDPAPVVSAEAPAPDESRDPPAPDAPRALVDVVVPLPPDAGKAVVPPPVLAEAEPASQPTEPREQAETADPEAEPRSQDVAAAPAHLPVLAEPAPEMSAASPPLPEPEVAAAAAQVAEPAPREVATIVVPLPPDAPEPIIPPPSAPAQPALAGVEMAPEQPGQALPDATGALTAIVPGPSDGQGTPAASESGEVVPQVAPRADGTPPGGEGASESRFVPLPPARSAFLSPPREARSDAAAGVPGLSGGSPAYDAGSASPDRLRTVPIPPRRPVLPGSRNNPATTSPRTVDLGAPPAVRPREGAGVSPLLPRELRPLSPRRSR